ncbi:MAG: hypothetical protein C4576_08210 [Desulfobacteraceae bacterium]|nr:MAG: hypothetical protein C4576_08210 [Desulfobacteraceae bacterium]
MEVLFRRSWSPYAAGAAIGALQIISMLVAKRPLGITTAFEQTAALAARKMAPEIMNSEAYERAKEESPRIGWEAGVVGGVVLGSMLSSRLSGGGRVPAVPDAWRQQVGPSRGVRYAAAAAGGALMMFGARMAKGCTSGHGISGTMQLSASSWIFTPVIFLTGAIVSRTLFGRNK